MRHLLAVAWLGALVCSPVAVSEAREPGGRAAHCGFSRAETFLVTPELRVVGKAYGDLSKTYACIRPLPRDPAWIHERGYRKRTFIESHSCEPSCAGAPEEPDLATSGKYVAHGFGG